MEIWKPIPGFEGLYEVSNIGRVKSLARRTYTSDGRPFRILRDKFISIKTNGRGYKVVGLNKNCEKYLKTVHRLVMLAFVGPSTLPVNHKNSKRDDNRLENLEYCTTAYNFEHGLLAGNCFANHGENSHVSKLSNKDRIFIIENEGILSTRELSEILNISIDSIRYYWKKPERYKKMLLQDFKSSQ